MKLEKIRVCNLEEPMGFAMDAPVFSWTVEGAAGKQQRWASLSITAAGESVYESGENADADSLGWQVRLPLKARTRYDFTVPFGTSAELRLPGEAPCELSAGKHRFTGNCPQTGGRE